MPFAIRANNLNSFTIIKISKFFYAIIRYKTRVALKTVVHPLNSIVRVMKMNQALLMCFTNVFWKNQTIYNITAYFTSNIITLRSCNFRILVTVFLNYIFIYAINNRQNFAISRITVSSKLALITITNIRFCNIIITALHQK